MGVLVRMCQELCRHIAHSSPPCTYRMVSLLHGEIDRYNGVSVSVKDVISPVTSVQDFHDILKESLKKWREEKRTAVWLQMSLDHSRYIEAAAAEGFKFHNAEDRQFLLKLWLRDGEDATPRFATHQLGVCGVVVKEDTKEVLVMQERKSQFSLWKFPGGLADLGENIEWKWSVHMLDQKHLFPPTMLLYLNRPQTTFAFNPSVVKGTELYHRDLCVSAFLPNVMPQLEKLLKKLV